MPLTLSLNPDGLRRILCLGAHADDIEIGCGGTLLKLIALHPRIEVRWEVYGASGARADEARRSAEAFLVGEVAKTVSVHEFRDGYFPNEWPAIKERIESIKRAFDPDLIFTHYRDDRHQDHRVLSDLAWNTFRNHLILEYEIPKYDGDLGQPGVYVPLPEDIVERKVSLLMRHFPTQATKHWFSEDLFRGMMRIRGMECASRHAEAFHGRKLVLGMAKERSEGA